MNFEFSCCISCLLLCKQLHRFVNLRTYRFKTTACMIPVSVGRGLVQFGWVLRLKIFPKAGIKALARPADISGSSKGGTASKFTYRAWQASLPSWSLAWDVCFLSHGPPHRDAHNVATSSRGFWERKERVVTIFSKPNLRSDIPLLLLYFH